MRRDQDRRMIHQRVAGRGRLGLEDVDRRAGDLARVQGLSQRGLVDQAAPGAVDDPHRGLHPGQLRRADDVAGLGGHRRVQGQEVAPRPQVIQPLDALDAQLLRLLGGQERVEADDRHAEPLRPLRHRQPDPAQPDDAQRLALELRAGELVAVPLAGFQAVVGLGDVPRQREQQRHGVLGRRDGVAARRVHHHDPAPGRRRHVDVVDAHAGAHDRLEPRLALEHLGGQLSCPTGSRSRRPPPAPARGPARPTRAWYRPPPRSPARPAAAPALPPPACPSPIPDAPRSRSPRSPWMKECRRGLRRPDLDEESPDGAGSYK